MSRQLNLNPSWSPDARALAYTTLPSEPRHLRVAHLSGRVAKPDEGCRDKLPAGLLAGREADRLHVRTRRKPRDLRDECRRQNLRRLTNHPAGDSSPTWSPSGSQIAFTSDRTGKAQIYVMNSADGSGVRRLTVNESEADRPTWSPPPFNEIAYAARPGPGYDIKVLEVATGRRETADLRRGIERGPRVGTRRTPPGVYIDARRWTNAGVHDWPRWTRPATDHARGQQPDPGVVELESEVILRKHMRDMRNTTIVVAVTLAVAVTAACGKKKVADRTTAAAREEPRRGHAESSGPDRARRGQDTGRCSRWPTTRSRTSRSTTSTATRRSSRCSSRSTAPNWTTRGRAIAQANAGVLKKYLDVGNHDRRALRRARNGRIQPGARRAARGRGEDLPVVAGCIAGSDPYGELRKGVPVRYGPQRRCLGQESTRATS